MDPTGNVTTTFRNCSTIPKFYAFILTGMEGFEERMIEADCLGTGFENPLNTKE